jgi:hypothetical protein
MKSMILSALATLLIVGMTIPVLTQSYYKYESIRDRAGTVMTGYKFDPYTDTSQAVNLRGWKNVSLVVKVRDSCSISVYYCPSYDGTNFFAAVLIDSLSNAANGGETKSFALPAAAFAFPAVKFVWIVSAFREGKTNDTLDMKVYKIQ